MLPLDRFQATTKKMMVKWLNGKLFHHWELQYFNLKGKFNNLGIWTKYKLHFHRLSLQDAAFRVIGHMESLKWCNCHSHHFHCDNCVLGIFCVTSIYAGWHLGIAFSYLLWRLCHLTSYFHFQTVSQKWLDRLNWNFSCACNWSSTWALL